MRVTRRLGLGIVGWLLVLDGFARGALADEPVAAREPSLMSETAEITTVADAFDKDDPFDLNLLVGLHAVVEAREHPPRNAARRRRA